MHLTEFECANCGAANMVKAADGQLVCSFCGSAFGAAIQTCPRCGHHHQAGARHCVSCGATILRDCPVCGADNWILSEFCDQCGRNLDNIERLTQRWQMTTQNQLAERRAAAGALKEREEQASQQRLNAMVEAERQRLEALARAEAERQAQERRLAAVLLIGGAVLLIIIIVVIVIAVLAG